MTDKESLLTGLPEGAESPQEAGDQEKEGLTPRQQRMAQLLTRLAATARSFLLYDPQNEAIHRFLKVLLEAFVSALREEGPLTFGVLPFELVFEGGPVYLNRDRERSLAFRLYRDGVREIRFRPGFGWEELAKLLEVLSIRYTGVHQREDDIVTLLWKAHFKHVDVVAVEGIIPDDEEVTSGAAAAGRGAAPGAPGRRGLSAARTFRPPSDRRGWRSHPRSSRASAPRPRRPTSPRTVFSSWPACDGA